MLADDEGVDAAGTDGKVCAQLAAETRGVEGCAGADDAVGGETGELCGSVREDVGGIGGDDEDGVRCRGSDARDDGGEESIVRLDELEAGLAWLLVDAGGDDDESCVGAVFVVAGADAGVGEVGGVADVCGLALGAATVNVDEDDVGGETAEEDRVRCRCADGAGADDDDLDGLSGVRGGVVGGVQGVLTLEMASVATWTSGVVDILSRCRGGLTGFRGCSVEGVRGRGG